jgi:hypothetical protein
VNRRRFVLNCGAAVALKYPLLRGWTSGSASPEEQRLGFDESVVGQPVNVALFGDLNSWINPDAAPHLREVFAGFRNPLRLADMPWTGAEFDVGVEWPEFRTIDKVVVQYAGANKAPKPGTQYLEYWVGITPRQGEWKAFEDDTVLGLPLETDGKTWTFAFSSRRTCKVRLRFQGQKQVEIESLGVYGPSKWKTGEVYIEWGHLSGEKSYDGTLEVYNGQVLEIRPVGRTQLQDHGSWTCRAGDGNMGGIVAKVLYTWGMDVDRTVLTLRTKSVECSFLPGEALEDEPIDISDFGVFVRNNSSSVDRPTYRRQNADKTTIIEAVTKSPEQSIENAYRNIRARRVTLSFIGVDSNNQKFGIAPDGHLVVGTDDPSSGKPMTPKFAVFFDSAEVPTFFENAPQKLENLFEGEHEKLQELEEGWLPIMINRWSENDLSFERTDFAALRDSPPPWDESSLKGTELALMVSQVKIRNNSPIPKTAQYYIKPWKPATGEPGYGAIPANAKNAWEATLRDNCVIVSEGDTEYALCYVDTHDRGSLSMLSPLGAAHYSVVVHPEQEHVIHTVIPGLLPPSAEASKLRSLAYDQLHQATALYWKDLLSKTMRVEIPDRHLQNIYNANLHHLLLVLTKDFKRGEHYPHAAMLYYGSIGSESSPVMQSMEMRGMSKRVESCLQAWLSTQGNAMPAGDYSSKEGGFFQFWPIYTVDQGAILWTLAEHYLYTRDLDWLRKVAPQIVAGCDFILRERKRTMKELPGGEKPDYYGLAPAGCVADMRDWEYSFMLNAYFYLGLKKSSQVLKDVDPENARRIATEAEDYLKAIRKTLRESIVISPVTRLRNNTSVPSVPAYLGLRGFTSEVKDSVDPDIRHGYVYDSTIGPFHLLKGMVLEPHDPEVTWMLNYLEDRFFMFSPLSSRVDLTTLSTDWFNQGGYEKLQPYYVHYQDAYLQRDQIPHFLRTFFNTLAAIADPQTLTFQEELDFSGGQPHKTHEEGWFFHQFRFMLVMEMGNDLFLARGTPRAWLEHGRNIAVIRAPSYFGELSYRIQSFSNEGRIQASVNTPQRAHPARLLLRLRHPSKARLTKVTVNGRPWKDFDTEKEWIALPTGPNQVEVVAYY